jgi:predicted transcriptional regulator
VTDSEETFELSAEAEEELLASIAEADRGEFFTREQVFAMLQYPGDS